MLVEVLAGFTGGMIVGTPLGFSIRKWWMLTSQEACDFILADMNRVVNMEEIEYAAHARKTELMRAGRRTQRPNTNPPARVHRMRRRNGTIRVYDSQRFAQKNDAENTTEKPE